MTAIISHSFDGFYVETYQPIKQPHLFHNIILVSDNTFPFYSKISRQPFNTWLENRESRYTHICCPMLLHAMNEETMVRFLKHCRTTLVNRGNLFLCFSVFHPTDSSTQKCLAKTPGLKRQNKCVVNPIGFGDISTLQDFFSENIWEINGLWPDNPALWDRIISNPLYIKQNCIKMFSDQFIQSEMNVLSIRNDCQMAVIAIRGRIVKC